jgi:hypothetical protein
MSDIEKALNHMIATRTEWHKTNAASLRKLKVLRKTGLAAGILGVKQPRRSRGTKRP